MGIGAAIVGAGAIGAVGNVVASSSAANAAQGAANSNNALQEQIYGKNTANEQPFINAGTGASTAIGDALGLNGAAGQKSSQSALQTYLNSTGYKFQLGQGIGAAQQSAASTGSLNSGATLKSLDEFGQGLASTGFNNYLGALQTQQGTGLSAANALAGVGTNYANSVSANNNSAASAAGNAALAGSNSLSSLLGNGVSSYALSQGLSSYGGAGALSGNGLYSGAGLAAQGIYT